MIRATVLDNRYVKPAGTAIALIVGVLLVVGCQNAGKVQFVTIGTGGVTGVYYPTGGAISRMINKKASEYKIKATVESTAGSVYNINGVLAGDLDFGIAQSDRQYQAWKGTAEWEDRGPQEKLRSVFAIHPEAVTLMAAVQAEIGSAEDLEGKRVNLGNPGSGQLQNARDVLDAFGISEGELSAEYVKAVEAPGLLQDGRLDAFFYTVGHPNGNIKEATSGRIKVQFVALHGAPAAKLIEAKPYYAPAIIPTKNYPSAENDSDVETIGVKATLVTSTDVPEDVVYAVVKEVFDNLNEFRTLHPAYSVLSKENMLQGLTAPLHPGAVKYFRENGMGNLIDENVNEQ